MKIDIYIYNTYQNEDYDNEEDEDKDHHENEDERFFVKTLGRVFDLCLSSGFHWLPLI